MALIDSLLSVLRDNDGDRLVLIQDKEPRLFKGGDPLRFFFPPNDEAMHQLLMDELLNDSRRAALARGESTRFSYRTDALGSFDVLVSGTQGQRATFTSTQRPAAAPEPPAPPQAPSPAPAAAALAAADIPDTPGVLLPELAALIEHAEALGASDLHLSHGEAALLRVDGALQAVGDSPVDVERLVGAALSSRQRAEVAAGGSADHALESPTGTRLRLNAYRHDGGWAAALRVLRRRAPALSQLGLPAGLEQLCDLPHGLVLVVGPTGSGKSTTLAALAAERLRRHGGVLITLEDPIEYALLAPAGALVRQRQVGQHVATFADGLRDALRQDPDVILVGEMRDAESIQLALTAAETGHLVLSTLHSRTAAQAVERIIDTYPPERQRQVRVQLADALRAVLAQRLLPARGPGRVAAVEVLRCTPAVAAMVRDGKTAQLPNAMQMGARDGQVPLSRAVEELQAEGRISAATAKAALR